MGRKSAIPAGGWTHENFRTEQGATLLGDMLFVQRAARMKGARILTKPLADLMRKQIENCLTNFQDRFLRLAGTSGQPTSRKAKDLPLSYTIPTPQHAEIWQKVVTEMFAEHGMSIVIEVRPAIQSVASDVLQKTTSLLHGTEPPVHAKKLLQAQVDQMCQLVTNIDETTRSKLVKVIKKGLENGDPPFAVMESVRNAIPEIATNRVPTIVRTEMGRAADIGTLAALRADDMVTHISVVGCEAIEPNIPTFKGIPTCNIKNVPIAESINLKFHINHTGCIIPSGFRRENGQAPVLPLKGGDGIGTWEDRGKPVPAFTQPSQLPPKPKPAAPVADLLANFHASQAANETDDVYFAALRQVVKRGIAEEVLYAYEDAGLYNMAWGANHVPDLEDILKYFAGERPEKVDRILRLLEVKDTSVLAKVVDIYKANGLALPNGFPMPDNLYELYKTFHELGFKTPGNVYDMLDAYALAPKVPVVPKPRPALTGNWMDDIIKAYEDAGLTIDREILHSANTPQEIKDIFTSFGHNTPAKVQSVIDKYMQGGFAPKPAASINPFGVAADFGLGAEEAKLSDAIIDLYKGIGYAWDTDSLGSPYSFGVQGLLDYFSAFTTKPPVGLAGIVDKWNKLKLTMTPSQVIAAQGGDIFDALLNTPPTKPIVAIPSSGFTGSLAAMREQVLAIYEKAGGKFNPDMIAQLNATESIEDMIYLADSWFTFDTPAAAKTMLNSIYAKMDNIRNDILSTFDDLDIYLPQSNYPLPAKVENILKTFYTYTGKLPTKVRQLAEELGIDVDRVLNLTTLPTATPAAAVVAVPESQIISELYDAYQGAGQTWPQWMPVPKTAQEFVTGMEKVHANMPQAVKDLLDKHSLSGLKPIDLNLNLPPVSNGPQLVKVPTYSPDPLDVPAWAQWDDASDVMYYLSGNQKKALLAYADNSGEFNTALREGLDISVETNQHIQLIDQVFEAAPEAGGASFDTYMPKSVWDANYAGKSSWLEKGYTEASATGSGGNAMAADLTAAGEKELVKLRYKIDGEVVPLWKLHESFKCSGYDLVLIPRNSLFTIDGVTTKGVIHIDVMTPQYLAKHNKPNLAAAAKPITPVKPPRTIPPPSSTDTPGAQTFSNMAAPNGMVRWGAGDSGFSGQKLHGVPLTENVKAGYWNKHTDVPLFDMSTGVNEVELVPTAGKRASAGVVIMEPDGRLWLVEPHAHYGGYDQTFPKGGLEPGLTAQQTALKECFEESGLSCELQGVLGDFEGTTSTTRYYLAKRTGGAPWTFASETQSVVLTDMAQASNLLNTARDKKILQAAIKAFYDGMPAALPTKPAVPIKPPKPQKPSKPVPKRPVVTVTNSPSNFPANAEAVRNLTDLGSAGGTTGARIVKDASGQKYIMKKGAMGVPAVRIAEEHAADLLYRAAGVNVPEGATYAMPDGSIVKLTKFLDGKIQSLGEYLNTATSAQRTKILAEAQKNFHIDAWLGNWDVAGADLDNLLVADGKLFRVDNGGSLNYRAQGARKGEQGVAPFDKNGVAELWTMRTHSIDLENINETRVNRSAQRVFGSASPYQIAREIQATDFDAILTKMHNVLLTDPNLTINGFNGADIVQTLQSRAKVLKQFSARGVNWERAEMAEAFFDKGSLEMERMHLAGIREKMPQKLLYKSGDDMISLYDEDGSKWDKLRTRDSSSKGRITGLGDQWLERVAKREGMDINIVNRIISEWAGSHASASWGGRAQAVKTWIAHKTMDNSKVSLSDFFWGGKSTPQLATLEKNITSYLKDIDPSLTIEKADTVFTAWHSFTQSILENVEIPNIDRKLGIARLYRGETESVSRLYGFRDHASRIIKKEGAYKRGPNESCSLVWAVKPCGGSDIYEQAVPLSRIHSIYPISRPGMPNNGGFFAGDGENEVSANLLGIRSKFRGRLSDIQKSLKPESRKFSDWDLYDPYVEHP